MDFEVTLRTAYADTDQMGFVHHSNYLKYLENARWEAFRNFGLTYKEIEALGILMPVVDVKLRYHKPIYYDEQIIIKMQFKLISLVKLSVDYHINDTNGELKNTATILLTFIKKATKKPCRIPDFIQEIISITTEQVQH